jgi:hypothetical protein
VLLEITWLAVGWKATYNVRSFAGNPIQKGHLAENEVGFETIS